MHVVTKSVRHVFCECTKTKMESRMSVREPLEHTHTYTKDKKERKEEKKQNIIINDENESTQIALNIQIRILH